MYSCITNAYKYNIQIVLFVFPLRRVYKNDNMPYYNYVLFFRICLSGLMIAADLYLFW